MSSNHCQCGITLPLTRSPLSVKVPQGFRSSFRSLPGDRFPTLIALGEHIWLDNRDERFAAGINALVVELFAPPIRPRRRPW
jgi:hypothetical protein